MAAGHLARLGILAMVCGTLASYLSAALAGILHTDAPTTGGAAMVIPAAFIIVGVAIISGFHVGDTRSKKHEKLVE